jgi:hypothetical protein
MSTSVLKPGFRVSITRSLINEIYNQRSFFYYFLGKVHPWEDDFNPPDSLNSTQEDVDTRDNLLYLRRVVPNDVSLVTYSNEWEPNLVYEMWDHTQALQDTNFFVVNNEFNVYKCLDNNNENVSTVEPAGTPLFAFNTSDGYLWKYMYNIPAFKRRKFSSRGFIPVQRAISDTFYNRGSIEEAVVVSAGSGYTESLLTNLVVEDTRLGSGATASIASVSAEGEITGVTLTDGGSNYATVDNPASVIITTINGSGAVFELTVVDGDITGIDIIDGGLNYTLSDTIIITTEECVVRPVISRTTGSILSVSVINSGSGYTSDPTITIVEDIPVGEGLYGNPKAVIKAFAFQGKVVNFTIEDPGQTYDVDTSTSIVVQGDGEGASFAPVILDGEIVDVVVENAGIGYSFINLTVIGAGTGAVVEGVFIQSDFVSDQSIVEQSAIQGAIHAIRVTEPGNSYSSLTQIGIIGDGTGAQAVPVIENGRLIKINMIAFGSGYTRAQVVITDSIRPPSTSFTDTEAYAILPPIKGHGFDAVEELYGNVLSVYSLLQGDAELSNIGQDYRQYGIIKNPVDLLGSRRLTDIRYFVSFDIQVSDATTIEPDDLLLNGVISYRVISKSGNLITVQQLSYRYEIPVGSFQRVDDPEVEYGITSVESFPTADKYSGDLLFLSNTPPFTPTAEQVVAVRTYIET